MWGDPHDIGLKSGKKRQNELIGALILADESIQFGVAELSIISLVPRTHRGKKRPYDHVRFLFFPRKTRSGPVNFQHSSGSQMVLTSGSWVLWNRSSVRSDQGG